MSDVLVGKNTIKETTTRRKRDRVFIADRKRSCCADEHPKTRQRLMSDGLRVDGDLPSVGSIILLNEIVKDPYCGLRGFRGCVRVDGYYGEHIVCTVIMNRDYSYTTTFRIMDFKKGLFIFEELESPIYTGSMRYSELLVRAQ